MHTKHSKGTAFQTNLFSISFEEEAFAYDLHNTYQRRKSARPETAEQIWIFVHFSWKNLNCGESSNQTHCFGPDRFPFYKSAMKFRCFGYMPYGLWNWFGLSDILSKFASKKTILNGKSLLWWLVLTVSYGAVKAHIMRQLFRLMVVRVFCHKPYPKSWANHLSRKLLSVWIRWVTSNLKVDRMPTVLTRYIAVNCITQMCQYSQKWWAKATVPVVHLQW